MREAIHPAGGNMQIFGRDYMVGLYVFQLSDLRNNTIFDEQILTGAVMARVFVRDLCLLYEDFHNDCSPKSAKSRKVRVFLIVFEFIL
jgi:hypothetical protein